MTREDIVRMAHEAGFGIGPMTESIYAETSCDKQLQRFAALVAEKEREECAAVCDEREQAFENYYTKGLPALCAAAIRARSKI